MELYIKQKVFSWNDKYSVCTISGEPIYNVQGELFSWGAKIHLYDMYNQELFYIKQKLMVFLPEYEIYVGDTFYARVKKEFSFLKPRINVESSNGSLTIEGSVWAMDFNIVSNGFVLGTIHKQWLNWGDTYCLTVEDPVNAAFFTSLVIAIDNCLHNQNNK